MPTPGLTICRQPQQGDVVIAASPGAPAGTIQAVFHKGRIRLDTEAGNISILSRRLVWSEKRHVWRCYSSEVMRLVDAPIQRLPAPGDFPLLGEYVRLDEWPLATCGWVIGHAQVRKGIASTTRGCIIATLRGPLTALAETLSYDLPRGYWRANVPAWVRSQCQGSRQNKSE